MWSCCWGLGKEKLLRRKEVSCGCVYMVCCQLNIALRPQTKLSVSICDVEHKTLPKQTSISTNRGKVCGCCWSYWYRDRKCALTQLWPLFKQLKWFFVGFFFLFKQGSRSLSLLYITASSVSNFFFPATLFARVLLLGWIFYKYHVGNNSRECVKGKKIEELISSWNVSQLLENKWK